MSDTELGSNLILHGNTRDEVRAAERMIRRQVAREHPGLTAEQLAQDPHIVQGLNELLEAVLGPKPRRKQ
ncbi:hypothetical protein [Streptomyces sp. cg35]|uniref:hypothetical protein n=1 Tax=Streptomyces sp. cg35 TaxID=3421650 RepID=UPI003D17F2F2